jgi:hypothetical protein
MKIFVTAISFLFLFLVACGDAPVVTEPAADADATEEAAGDEGAVAANTDAAAGDEAPAVTECTCSDDAKGECDHCKTAAATPAVDAAAPAATDEAAAPVADEAPAVTKEEAGH